MSPGTVDEDAGGTAIEVTGTVDGALRTAETAVAIAVSAGTASAGDFAAVPDFTLTITAGQASGTVTFRLTPVDIAVDDETVRVSGTAQGLTVTGSAVTVEDDGAAGGPIGRLTDPRPLGKHTRNSRESGEVEA